MSVHSRMSHSNVCYEAGAPFLNPGNQGRVMEAVDVFQQVYRPHWASG